MRDVIIEMEFVEKGWRSSLLSSLCCKCPLDVRAGCCRIKSTLFWGDLGYIAIHHPELFPVILNKPTAQLLPHGVAYECIDDKCTFLKQNGCELPAATKSLMCRTFACRGLGLENHPIGKEWLVVLARLSKEECRKNSELAGKVAGFRLKHPLDIMDKVDPFLAEYTTVYNAEPRWIKEVLGESSLQIHLSKIDLLAWELH
jgi:hypothetical protein